MTAHTAGHERAADQSPALAEKNVADDDQQKGRYGVLNIIAAQELMRPTEIADELDMMPSSVSRHLQALLAEGLVAVSGNPDDRRSSLVTSTDTGRAPLERFEGAESPPPAR